jgi:hypothetical protein
LKADLEKPKENVKEATKANPTPPATKESKTKP